MSSYQIHVYIISNDGFYKMKCDYDDFYEMKYDYDDFYEINYD